MSKPEEKMVFGISGHNGELFILLGVPEPAWEYMADGKTHHFDLAKAGAPIKLMVFGGKTRADCLKAIEDHNAKQGVATLRQPGKDFGIDGAA